MTNPVVPVVSKGRVLKVYLHKKNMLKLRKGRIVNKMVNGNTDTSIESGL